MAAVVFLFLMFPLISAQSIGWGPCPTPDVKKNFYPTKFMGKWYEIEKIPYGFAPGKCTEIKYRLVQTDTIHFIYSYTYKDKEIQKGGSAKIPDKEEQAKLKMGSSGIFSNLDYWVLDTNYHNYAVVYSCTNICKFFNYKFAWILGRRRSLSPKTIYKAKELLKKAKVNVSRMKTTDQDC